MRGRCCRAAARPPAWRSPARSWRATPTLTIGPRIAFFEALATTFGHDRARIDAAIAAWRQSPSDETAAELHRRQRAAAARAVSPAQPCARRHRRAGAHARATARRHGPPRRSRRRSTTISSICSRRGSTAAFWCCAASTGRPRRSILEKIIRYEAVHEIQDWDDLRRRIDPPDRRCYAFFHPALVDEPLIFVEVALTARNPGRDRADPGRQARRGRPGARDDGGVLFDHQLPARARRRDLRPLPDQAGGRGGVARGAARLDLRHAVAGAEFRRMAQARARQRGLAGARRRRSRGACGARPPGLVARCRKSPRRSASRCCAPPPGIMCAAATAAACRSMRSRASISATARGSSGSTGSAIRRSGRLQQSYGLMVNYLYDLDYIEKNHEAYAQQHAVVASSAVTRLVARRCAKSCRFPAEGGMPRPARRAGNGALCRRVRARLSVLRTGARAQQHLSRSAAVRLRRRRPRRVAVVPARPLARDRETAGRHDPAA